ncbi:sesquipedalian-1 [Daphnia magna]|uniref:Pleckstrin domain-containing family J member 1 n=2 Tax=Daphnia magna TaxID=35525 RepID=A0A162C8S9_9CRUS|nr:sesquipedalian-1 [Daphnia magna]KAK4035495.1 hypothetical protein OUZ56_027582 [Daphnia magna]KZS12872.1 Pleckstrin domain-containing family J member 1 [Daphnia magna]
MLSFSVGINMKVNEKNLIAIANAPNLVVDKEGWLSKKGENSKGFQKRWFVLKGNLLYYFEKRTDKEPAGVVIVEGCTVELSEEDEAYSFNIKFHGPGDRTFVLSAENQELMEEWMKAVTCASYDYMKVMVTELQKQVDELTELERLRKLGFNSVIDGSTLPPVVPSRQRHNPFNLVEREANINVTTRKVNKKQNFSSIHNEYGQQIIRERDVWKKDKKLKGTSGTSTISEDVLVVL